MPKHKEIVKYWREKLEEMGIELLEGKAGDRQCFACGWIGAIERAHIVAKVEGGADSVENLHNLCKFCHIESELLKGEVYFEWLKFKVVCNMDGAAWRSALFMVRFYKNLYITNGIDSVPEKIKSVIKESQPEEYACIYLGEEESDRIGVRVRAAMKAKAERGEKIGAPQNLTPTARAKGLQARKDNAAACPEWLKALPIAAELRAKGETFRAIADCLNKSGFLTPRGAAFQEATVHRLLSKNTITQ
jgi:hypothetical protein